MKFKSNEYDKYVAYIAALDEKLKPKTLRFRGLPFFPDYKRFIFVESGFNSMVNCFILQNYGKMLARFRRCNCRFLYVPAMALKFMDDEFAEYYRPFDKTKAYTAIRSNFMNNYLVDKEQIIVPSLIVFSGMNVDGVEVYGDSLCDLRLASNNRFVDDVSTVEFEFTQYELHVDKWSSIGNYLNDLLERLSTTCTSDNNQSAVPGLSIPCNSMHADTETIYMPDERPEADVTFESDVKALIDEVREKVNLLRQSGVNEYILKQILQPELKLSRLLITEWGRIYLLDYGTGRNGLEIQMHTLDKAVFFLFLRHPEGIIFKELPTYSDELYEIYYRLCNGTKTVAEMRASVDDVTNPFSNSINEKCSRIRQAFIREFDDSLASHYYIYGKRGEAKKIALDRSLVTDRFAK